MIDSKQKGKRGEKEAAAFLQSIIKQPVFVDVQSNGADIVSIKGLSVEVKRGEHPLLKEWWEQTTRQAAEGTTAILMYRANHQTWKFCIPADELLPGTEGFIQLSAEVFRVWAVSVIDKRLEV